MTRLIDYQTSTSIDVIRFQCGTYSQFFVFPLSIALKLVSSPVLLKVSPPSSSIHRGSPPSSWSKHFNCTPIHTVLPSRPGPLHRSASSWLTHKNLSWHSWLRHLFHISHPPELHQLYVTWKRIVCVKMGQLRFCPYSPTSSPAHSTTTFHVILLKIFLSKRSSTSAFVSVHDSLP